MLKKHAQFFKSLFIMSDLVVIGLAWLLSHMLRFYLAPLPPPLLGIPPFSTYVQILLPLWLIWGFVSKKSNLYQPRRLEHFLKEFLEIAKTLTLTVVILVAVIYLLRRFEFSRLAFLYFWVLGMFGLMISRFVARKTLKSYRRRGFNQRFALIVGAGELGQKVLEKIELYPELGIRVIGFLSCRPEDINKRVKDTSVIGTYSDLERIQNQQKIDVFFIALPITEYAHLGNVLRSLQNHSSDIKVVPGAYEFINMRGGVDELDGLPFVSLQNSPLYGWNMASKRLFDLILGGLLSVVLSPLLVVIALLVKISSKGPILYRQERVGMDGHPFRIIKFRTMKADAEQKTGPVWAEVDDLRRTAIGSFLRRSSLDELPQLFNVLKGEMSLVGPRPERPNFVKEFRRRIPSYMLRHKIKAGMTGWAQVNGWRGNTSLEKRIEHDLFYIQNWSIGLDMKILLMTLWKGSFSKSAY
jgi:Undecaprenyl-phosphate glucose phosphotransferase